MKPDYARVRAPVLAIYSGRIVRFLFGFRSLTGEAPQWD
jgi:hypothetical protein